LIADARWRRAKAACGWSSPAFSLPDRWIIVYTRPAEEKRHGIRRVHSEGIQEAEHRKVQTIEAK